MTRAILLAAVLAISGCVKTEAVRDQDVVTRETERHEVRGTVAGHPVDVVLTTQRDSEQITHEDRSETTGIDEEALARAFGAVIGPLVKTAGNAASGGLLGQLGAIVGSPGGMGAGGALIAAIGGLGIRERRRRKIVEKSEPAEVARSPPA